MGEIVSTGIDIVDVEEQMQEWPWPCLMLSLDAN